MTYESLIVWGGAAAALACNQPRRNSQAAIPPARPND